MTKAMMALGTEKTESVRMVLDLDDTELVKKAKTAPGRTTTPKEDSSFTNSANLGRFRRSVKQKENREVVESTPELWKELLSLWVVMN